MEWQNGKKEKKMSKDFCPAGKFHKTGRTIKPVRVSVRRIYKKEPLSAKSQGTITTR